MLIYLPYNCFQSENKHETEQYEERESAIVGSVSTVTLTYDSPM